MSDFKPIGDAKILTDSDGRILIEPSEDGLLGMIANGDDHQRRVTFKQMLETAKDEPAFCAFVRETLRKREEDAADSEVVVPPKETNHPELRGAVVLLMECLKLPSRARLDLSKEEDIAYIIDYAAGLLGGRRAA